MPAGRKDHCDPSQPISCSLSQQSLPKCLTSGISELGPPQEKCTPERQPTLGTSQETLLRWQRPAVTKGGITTRPGFTLGFKQFILRLLRTVDFIRLETLQKWKEKDISDD